MCRSKNAERPLEITELWEHCQENDRKDFSRSCQLSQKKRPNLTRRIASISIRKESLYRPSIPDWRCEYSPEGTHVIPCEGYVSYFVLKISKIWKEFEENIRSGSEFIYTGSEILIPDLRLFVSSDNSGDFICIRSSLLPNWII